MVRIVTPKASPYNRTTLDSIRLMVRQKRTEEAIADAIGWTLQELQQRAAHHQIKLRRPGEAARITIGPKPQPMKKPQDTRQRFRETRNGHPRNKYLAVAISEAALKSLKQLSAVTQKSPPALIGFMIDFAARNGKTQALFEAAMAEESEA